MAANPTQPNLLSLPTVEFVDNWSGIDATPAVLVQDNEARDCPPVEIQKLRAGQLLGEVESLSRSLRGTR